MIKAQKTVDITNSKLQTTWKFTKLWTTTNEEVEAIFIGNTLNLYDKVGMTMLQRSVWQCELMSCYKWNQYDNVSSCHAEIEIGMTYQDIVMLQFSVWQSIAWHMTWRLSHGVVWQCLVMSYSMNSVWQFIAMSYWLNSVWQCMVMSCQFKFGMTKCNIVMLHNSVWQLNLCHATDTVWQTRCGMTIYMIVIPRPKINITWF